MGLLKSLILLGVGFYGGVYACQNYNIPKLDRPEVLFDKLKDFVTDTDKKYRKDKDDK